MSLIEEVKYRWIDDFTLLTQFGGAQMQLRPGMVLGSVAAIPKPKHRDQTWERLWTFPYKTYTVDDLISWKQREVWRGWLQHLVVPMSSTRFIIFFNVTEYYDSIAFDPTDSQTPSVAYDVDMSRFTAKRLELERGTYLLKHGEIWHYGPKIFP
jgi:hypothetical protein